MDEPLRLCSPTSLRRWMELSNEESGQGLRTRQVSMTAWCGQTQRHPVIRPPYASPYSSHSDTRPRHSTYLRAERSAIPLRRHVPGALSRSLLNFLHGCHSIQRQERSQGHRVSDRSVSPPPIRSQVRPPMEPTAKTSHCHQKEHRHL